MSLGPSFSEADSKWGDQTTAWNILHFEPKVHQRGLVQMMFLFTAG